MYIWESKDWPSFTWDHEQITTILASVRLEQGRLIGRMQALGFELRQEAHLRILTEEIQKSAKIEGEIFTELEVRSSVARRLGIEIAGLTASADNVDGFVEMMIDATSKNSEALTLERLFVWHSALFPTEQSGMTEILTGEFRDDSKGRMQVISGSMGKENVHFEAPPADQLAFEMDRFLEWLNSSFSGDLVLQAGIAHLWFLTLHPFDDGNGRIGRAISDMLLARSENGVPRFYSLSSQIELERKGYYGILEGTQRGTLDITPWLEWFLGCLERAILGAHNVLGDVLLKSEFWKRFTANPFNDRQSNILSMLLDGFKGKLTSSKYAKISKCSQDTAYRDILDLIEKGALVKDSSGGRSTSYSLVL